MDKKQIAYFSIIHLLGALLLPLLIFLLGGCFEPEKLEQASPVACDEVEKALQTGVAGSEKKINVGQWAQVEYSYAPLSNPPTVIDNTVRQILVADRQVDPDDNSEYYNLRLLRTVYKTVNGQEQKETKEETDVAPKGFGLCSDGVTYYGLTVSKSRIAPPKTGCAPYADCRINATDIRFDQLITVDGTQERVRYYFLLSSDVPYLARMLEFCVTQTVNVNGQQIPVSQCNTVRNFDFTTPNS